MTEVLDSYDKLTIYHHQDGLVYLKIDANGGEYRWKYDSDRKLLQKQILSATTICTNMTNGATVQTLQNPAVEAYQPNIFIKKHYVTDLQA